MVRAGFNAALCGNDGRILAAAFFRIHREGIKRNHIQHRGFMSENQKVTISAFASGGGDLTTYARIFAADSLQKQWRGC
jgi:hypothetical protein